MIPEPSVGSSLFSDIDADFSKLLNGQNFLKKDEPILTGKNIKGKVALEETISISSNSSYTSVETPRGEMTDMISKTPKNENELHNIQSSSNTQSDSHLLEKPPLSSRHSRPVLENKAITSKKNDNTQSKKLDYTTPRKKIETTTKKSDSSAKKNEYTAKKNEYSAKKNEYTTKNADYSGKNSAYTAKKTEYSAKKNGYPEKKNDSTPLVNNRQLAYNRKPPDKQKSSKTSSINLLLQISSKYSNADLKRLKEYLINDSTDPQMIKTIINKLSRQTPDNTLIKSSNLNHTNYYSPSTNVNRKYRHSQIISTSITVSSSARDFSKLAVPRQKIPTSNTIAQLYDQVEDIQHQLNQTQLLSKLSRSEESLKNLKRENYQLKIELSTILRPRLVSLEKSVSKNHTSNVILRGGFKTNTQKHSENRIQFLYRENKRLSTILQELERNIDLANHRQIDLISTVDEKRDFVSSLSMAIEERQLKIKEFVKLNKAHSDIDKINKDIADVMGEIAQKRIHFNQLISSHGRIMRERRLKLDRLRRKKVQKNKESLREKEFIVEEKQAGPRYNTKKHKKKGLPRQGHIVDPVESIWAGKAKGEMQSENNNVDDIWNEKDSNIWSENNNVDSIWNEKDGHIWSENNNVDSIWNEGDTSIWSEKKNIDNNEDNNNIWSKKNEDVISNSPEATIIKNNNNEDNIFNELYSEEILLDKHPESQTSTSVECTSDFVINRDLDLNNLNTNSYQRPTTSSTNQSAVIVDMDDLGSPQFDVNNLFSSSTGFYR